MKLYDIGLAKPHFQISRKLLHLYTTDTIDGVVVIAVAILVVMVGDWLKAPLLRRSRSRGF